MVDIQFNYITSIISSAILGLELFASIYVGCQKGFGFPAYYIGVSCLFGSIAYALTAAVSASGISDYAQSSPYLYTVTLFIYLFFLMLLFLPVLAVFFFIRHNSRHGTNGGSPKVVKILVYIGFFFVVVSLALLIAFLGLTAAFLSDTSITDYDTYLSESNATDMVLWYYIVFWVVVALFHRSIPIPSLLNFNSYGVLITLPMIIITIVLFEPTAAPWYFPAGQYALFVLFNIPLFFAIALVLINARHWIPVKHDQNNNTNNSDNNNNTNNEQNQPQSV